MKGSNDSSNVNVEHRLPFFCFLSLSLLFSISVTRAPRFILLNSDTELLVRMHEKWKRNNDQTKEIAYSNTVEHTHTPTHVHVHRTGEWVEIIKSVCFAVAFALVTHKNSNKRTQKSGYIIENISMHTGT